MIYLSLASLPNHRLESMKWKLLPWRSHQSRWIFWRWRRRKVLRKRLQFVWGVKSSDLSINVKDVRVDRSNSIFRCSYMYEEDTACMCQCVRVKHDVSGFCFYWSCFVFCVTVHVSISIWWITHCVLLFFVINIACKIFAWGRDVMREWVHFVYVLQHKRKANSEGW